MSANMPGSDALSQGGIFPTSSTQASYHELARSMPPPRKQNTACDACRSRKVKCHQIPGQPKCQHCVLKNYQCTHHIQQATTEKKRNASAARKPRKLTNAAHGPQTEELLQLDVSGQQNANSISHPGPIGHSPVPSLQHRSSSTSTITSHISYSNGSMPYSPTALPFSNHSSSPSSLANAITPLPHSPSTYYSDTSSTMVLPSYQHLSAQQQSQPYRYRRNYFRPPITRSTHTKELLDWLFSPPVPSSSTGILLGPNASSYDEWGELASKLDTEEFRLEFALDLIEIYFQIVHTRWPLIDRTTFREKFNGHSTSSSTTVSQQQSPHTNSHHPTSPASTKSSSTATAEALPLHPALVATILAWGTKFSEHQLLITDRARDRDGRSSLARAMVERSRELAEALGVHRISNEEHLIISLLLEPLQSQLPNDPEGYHGFWLAAAIKHCLDLHLSHRSVMAAISDLTVRGTMIFAWWMTCLADAYHAVYYRKMPLINDGDYDIDFYTVETAPTDGSHESKPTGEQLEFLGYYQASHDLAHVSRKIAHCLWQPGAESSGIPFASLEDLRRMLDDWRERFLKQVGVPSNLEKQWDFISAISACASDATFHLMWIVVFDAVDDYGIKEVKEERRRIHQGHGHHHTQPHMNPALQERIREMQTRLAHEAESAALRIAALAGVLASNGYLRLDPAVMNVSVFKAGMLLGRLGRPEVTQCIEGLKQYSYAYEDGLEQVNMIQRASNRGSESFNHMGAYVNPLPAMPMYDGGGQQPMNIDSGHDLTAHSTPYIR